MVIVASWSLITSSFTFIILKRMARISSEIHLLCSTEKKVIWVGSSKVNIDWIYIFGETIPLMLNFMLRIFHFLVLILPILSQDLIYQICVVVKNQDWHFCVWSCMSRETILYVYFPVCSPTFFCIKYNQCSFTEVMHLKCDLCWVATFEIF